MTEADCSAALGSPLPRLLDVRALAEHLGVTVRHVRRLVAERRIPFLKWGHLVRFDPDEIAEWLQHARIPEGRATWSSGSELHLARPKSGPPRGMSASRTQTG
jgi:excisionase family DNA binding protein